MNTYCDTGLGYNFSSTTIYNLSQYTCIVIWLPPFYDSLLGTGLRSNVWDLAHHADPQVNPQAFRFLHNVKSSWLYLVISSAHSSENLEMRARDLNRQSPDLAITVYSVHTTTTETYY